MPAFLITQCLQQDFVSPLAADEPVPNHLHIGPEEALRLLGEDPARGPLPQLMGWAHGTKGLRVVHIRDWHADVPAQQGHLERFGRHCLAGTPGAAFAFPVPEPLRPGIAVIDSPSLNDFLGTPLAGILAPLEQAGARAGIIGVWTDAKVSFLAYELRTRFPDADLAVCSQLCASPSRAQHFVALAQLERLLGVRVMHTVDEFRDFLAQGLREAT